MGFATRDTKLINNQADKLQTIIKAANVQDVESIWTTLFAKACCSCLLCYQDVYSDISQALEGKNVKDLLLNVGSGGGAAAAPTGGASGGAPADAPADEPKKEEKEEGRSPHTSFQASAC